ncbi:PAS domain S-box protein [Pleurocapsales cyanobacterium LEGE 10410]|nr:PAS domain S-box protein [Pleurocapsales cyanobacterium LEGE 10410]
MNERAEISEQTIDTSPIKKTRTVMLLEDNEIDRQVYQRYLRSDLEHEYAFIEAELREVGLATYAPELVDVIVLDFMLPDMNGLEWLALWQQQNSEPLPPVIVLTGQGDENTAVQFIKMGAADYIVKNQLTPEKFKLAIDRAIALKQLEREKADLVSQLIAGNEELQRRNQLWQMEVAKKESLQQILNNVPLVVYAKDIDPQTKRSGKFWLVNREYQRIFDLSEAEIIGKSDRDLFSPEIVEAFAVNDQTVVETRMPLTTEEEVYHGDGQLHEYLSFKFPLFDEKQQVVSIVGIAKDITEDKQFKAQLEMSEVRFRSTFEQAAVGIAHVAPDGRWLRVNQKFCQIVGYTKPELLQKTFQEITHPEDLQLDLEYIRQMLSGEIESFSIEKRYLRQNNTVVWINLTVSLVRNSAGEPDYFISVVEDISDRHELKVSLQKSLRRLSNLHLIDRAILEVQEPQEISQIAIANIRKFLACQRVTIVAFEPEQETATILATRSIAGQTTNGLQMSLKVWQNLIAQIEQNLDHNYFVAYLSQLPELSTAVPQLQIAGLNCLIAFPLKVGGTLLGILKIWVENLGMVTTEELNIVSEVSNQLAIALQQARLYKQNQIYTQELETKVAQRTAQLEEINQELKAFTYSISHDLKAPLRAIQGFATALQEDYGENLDNLGNEYTWRLINSAQQMEKLIQDLLTYSRLTRSQIQLHSVNLSAIVAKLIEQLEFDQEQKQAQITVDEPLSPVMGSKTILLQIIDNLLSNAIKFVAPGTTSQVHIWTEETGQTVRLWIEDNGIGIKPEHQERIFQVFERLHGNESYFGTGIGLAIAKKGIERLGGKIGVDSQPDRGSRFWIECPKS